MRVIHLKYPFISNAICYADSLLLKEGIEIDEIEDYIERHQADRDIEKAIKESLPIIENRDEVLAWLGFGLIELLNRDVYLGEKYTPKELVFSVATLGKFMWNHWDFKNDELDIEPFLPEVLIVSPSEPYCEIDDEERCWYLIGIKLKLGSRNLAYYEDAYIWENENGEELISSPYKYNSILNINDLAFKLVEYVLTVDTIYWMIRDSVWPLFQKNKWIDLDVIDEAESALGAEITREIKSRICEELKISDEDCQESW